MSTHPGAIAWFASKKKRKEARAKVEKTRAGKTRDERNAGLAANARRREQRQKIADDATATTIANALKKRGAAK